MGNCGKGVRASISKPTPFIYLAFEKWTHSCTGITICKVASIKLKLSSIKLKLPSIK